MADGGRTKRNSSSRMGRTGFIAVSFLYSGSSIDDRWLHGPSNAPHAEQDALYVQRAGAKSTLAVGAKRVNETVTSDMNRGKWGVRAMAAFDSTSKIRDP